MEIPKTNIQETVDELYEVSDLAVHALMQRILDSTHEDD